MSRLQEINEPDPGRKPPVRRCSGCGCLPRFDEDTVTRIHADRDAWTIDHKSCPPGRNDLLDERRLASNDRVIRGA